MSALAIINYATALNYVDVHVSPLRSILFCLYFAPSDWRTPSHFFQSTEYEMK